MTTLARRYGMRVVAIVIGILALLIVGAGARAAETRAAVTVHSSRYGHILFDGRGFVLYVFTHDRHGRSTCTATCAAAWPPFLVRRKPAGGGGARRSLLGTTRRADGRLQATYRGRPLYYYVGDRKPGQILCQNVSEFGGLWLVVRPSGVPVR
jgi:predicted lipoprotein with Yx(FWY)xxD motif